MLQTIIMHTIILATSLLARIAQYFQNAFQGAAAESVYFQGAALVVFVGLLFLFLIKKRSNRRFLLTQLIDDELKKHSSWASLGNIIRECYFPSFLSFFIVLVAVFGCAGVAYLVHLFVPATFKTLIALPSRTDLIAVHAGIGTLIFALIIFIAEYIKNDVMEARVLLRESYLYPLVLSEIFVFLTFVFLDFGSINSVLVFLVGIFAIISISRLIKILLNRYQFFTESIRVLKERLRKSMSLAAKERVGNNILLKRLDSQKIKLKFRLWGIERLSDFHQVYAPRLGVISEIKLNCLEDISVLLDTAAKRNGYSYADSDYQKSSQSPPSFSQDVEKAQQKKMSVPNSERYVLAKYKDSVDSGNKALLAFEKKLIGDDLKILEKIRNIARDAFVITDAENFSEQIKVEMLDIKDQLIDAIASKKAGRIEELIKLYRGMAEAFLEYWTQMGIVYDAETARKERGYLIGGWNEIRWVKDDIYEIFDKSLSFEDQAVIKDIYFLPVSIAIESVKQANHYLFQEFIDFMVSMYASVLRSKKSPMIGLIRETTARNLYEIAAYYVYPRLKQNQLSDLHVNIAKDSIIYILKIFQNLMKCALDFEDPAGFDAFDSALTKVEESLGLNREWAFNGSGERPQFVAAVEEIDISKNVMSFGFGAWLFFKLKDNNSDALRSCCAAFERRLSELNLEELILLLLRVHKREEDEFWGWFWWDAPKGGGAYTSNIDYKLNLYFLYLALKKMARLPSSYIDSIKLPLDRQLTDMIRGAGALTSILNAFKEKDNYVRGMLNAKELEKIADVEVLFKKSIQAYDEERARTIRTKSIDHIKVQEFKQEVLNGYSSAAQFKRLFKELNLFRDCTNESTPEKLRFGINIVEDKAVFFKDWDVSYHEWGEHFGQNIAEGEDLSVAQHLADSCSEIPWEQLKSTIESLDCEPFVIVTGRGALALDRVGKIERSKRSDEHELFVGNLDVNGRHIPVFKIRTRKKKFDLLILSKLCLGTLTFFSPLNSAAEKPSKADQFFISVEPFIDGDKLLRDFIAKPPDWLKKMGDSLIQENYLKEHVLLQIYEKFKFEKAEKFIGYKSNAPEIVF